MSVKCPKGEIVWQTIYDKDHRLRYFVTSRPVRDFYFLYRVAEDGSIQKLGRDKLPPALLEKHKVLEACRGGK